MVDKLRMSWMGVVMFVGLCVTSCVLYFLGKDSAAGVVLAMLAGQALPQPVKMHEGAE